MYDIKKILSFAYIHDAIVQKKDITYGIARLFYPIIEKNAGKNFEPVDFAQEVTNYYGIQMHAKAAEFFADRLLSLGFLEEINGGRYKQIIYKELEQTSDIQEEDIEQLYNSFVEYAKPKLSQHSLEDYDESTLKYYFNDYLLKKDIFSLDVSEDENRMYYLSASFINFIHKNEKYLFETCQKLVSGLIISEVVISLQAPYKSESLPSLTVYLDAPIILALLGLESVENVRNSKTLIDYLKEYGIVISTFRHHLDEAKIILKSIIKRVDGIVDEKPFRPLGRRLLHEKELLAHARIVVKDIEPQSVNNMR